MPRVPTHFYSFTRDTVTACRHVVECRRYDIDSRMAAYRLWMAVVDDDATAADIHDLAATLMAIFKRHHDGDRVDVVARDAAERLCATLVFHSPWKPTRGMMPPRTLCGFPFNCDPYAPVAEREFYAPADDPRPT